MKIKFALSVWCASVIFGIAPMPPDSLCPATAAETNSGVVDLIRHAQSSADHQKLVKWYEQREDEVRNQAKLFRKLALDYQAYRETAMTTACEDVAGYYDEIAQQFEKLAEQHRHLAAHAP